MPTIGPPLARYHYAALYLATTPEKLLQSHDDNLDQPRWTAPLFRGWVECRIGRTRFILWYYIRGCQIDLRNLRKRDGLRPKSEAASAERALTVILPVGGKSSEDRAGELLADVKTLSRRPSRRAGSASRWIYS